MKYNGDIFIIKAKQRITFGKIKLGRIFKLPFRNNHVCEDSIEKYDIILCFVYYCIIYLQ